MTDKLLISVEPLELPTDFDEQTEFRARISGPVRAFRAALSEALGRDVGVKYEMATPVVPVIKRGRKPRAAVPVEPLGAVSVPAPNGEAHDDTASAPLPAAPHGRRGKPAAVGEAAA